MNLTESKDQVIFNLDLIETDDNNSEIESDEDFSGSVVKDTVWRAGNLNLNPKAGGIWFGDSKKGVEDFALSVRNEKREGKPYKINLKNPFHISDFWNEYMDHVGYVTSGRKDLMEWLIKEGYDGIIIGDDWWNDTGDEYAVYGKQYIVFDPKQIKRI